MSILGLRSSDIYPAHREKLDRWVRSSPSDVSNKEFTDQDQEIPRIFRYYQHMGLLPRVEGVQREHFEEARQTVVAMGSARMPGSRGDLLAGTRIADDTVSIARNFLYIIPPTGWIRFITEYLGVGAGTLWSTLALQELASGIREQARAKKIGDREGVQRARARIGSGVFISGASLAYLGGTICRHFEVAANVINGLLFGANALFGAGSLLAAGASATGVLRCNRFRDRLDEYLRHPTLPLKDRMKGAISFLKDSLSVTPEESQQILAQIEVDHPEFTPVQKEELFRQKCTDLTEAKIKYTKRRTSTRSVYQILQSADSILQKLEDPSQIDAGIREATLLVYSIRKDNVNKKILYAIGFLASVISVLALLIMLCFHLEIVAMTLYGISGAMCLGMTISSIHRIFLNRRLFSEHVGALR